MKLVKNNVQDLFASRTARDKALEKVAENSDTWFHDCLYAMRYLSRRRDWTGEDIRILLADSVGEPHHPNAWGALIGSAVRQGLLIPTGEYTSMRMKKSHARKTPLYRAPSC